MVIVSLVVKQLDPSTFEAYLNNRQLGQYSSLAGAKSALRRKLPNPGRLQWMSYDAREWRCNVHVSTKYERMFL